MIDSDIFKYLILILIYYIIKVNYYIMKYRIITLY